VQRALDKRAPFHRAKNSVADALLIECDASAIRAVDLAGEPHGFITSNSQDFSATAGDQRRPHQDLAPLFADSGSVYGLGVDGLDMVLREQLGEEYDELLEELNFEEEPRRLDEILSAEKDRCSTQAAWKLTSWPSYFVWLAPAGVASRRSSVPRISGPTPTLSGGCSAGNCRRCVGC
jgi:hypothetical protein